MARNIVFYKTYFMDFYLGLDPKTQEKIEFVMDIVKQADKIPAKFFKHIEGSDGLFEIRATHHGNIYRIFCFFDGNKLVILLNGFKKKTQKTPKKEIKQAMKLKKEYFENKKGGAS
jgi:phage-related protein